MRIRRLSETCSLVDDLDVAELPALANHLQAHLYDGVEEVVASYSVLGIYGTPSAGWEDWILDASALKFDPTESRLVQIPVDYSGEDLDWVAQSLGMSPRQVVESHTSGEYRCFAMGFQPGFGYLGPLPVALRGLARRSSPRTRVPAGSVALCMDQTAVYPGESPGGWHLIGITQMKMVDLEQEFFALQVGDRVRFVEAPLR